MADNRVTFEKDGSYRRGDTIKEMDVKSGSQQGQAGSAPQPQRPAASISSIGAPSPAQSATKAKPGSFNLSALRQSVAKASSSVAKTTLPEQGADNLGKVVEVPRAGDDTPATEPKVVEGPAPAPVSEPVEPAVEELPEPIFAVKSVDDKLYIWDDIAGAFFKTTYSVEELELVNIAGGFYRHSKAESPTAVETVSIIRQFFSLGIEVESMPSAGTIAGFVARNSANQTFEYSGGQWKKLKDDSRILTGAPGLCPGVVAVFAPGDIEVRENFSAIAGAITTIVEGTKYIEPAPAPEPEEPGAAKEPTPPVNLNSLRESTAAQQPVTAGLGEASEVPTEPAGEIKELKLDTRTEEHKAADAAEGFTGQGFRLVSAKEFYGATSLSDGEIARWAKKCMKVVVSAPAAILSLAREPKVRFYNFLPTNHRDSVVIVLGFGDIVTAVSVNMSSGKVAEATHYISIVGEDVKDKHDCFMAVYSERLRPTTIV